MDKQAAILPNVEGFLLYLSGALTQYDQRASKRRGYNPYALGHYMKALQDIRSSVSSVKNSQEPEALEKLKKNIEHYFVPNFPPAKNTVKAIDMFLETGVAPKYPGVKRAEEGVSAELARRVVARYLEATGDFITVEELADICLPCAHKFASAGITRLWMPKTRMAAEYEPPAGPKELGKYYSKCRDQGNGKEYCARVAWNIYCSNVNPSYEGCTEYGKGWGAPYSGPLSK